MPPTTNGAPRSCQESRKPVRLRRRSAEVRQLLVEAATRVFRDKGFAQATTDDIAAEASVTVSATYRHFRNKSELFRESVVQPFLDSLQESDATWRGQLDQPWDEWPLMRALLTDFYDSLHGHRDAVIGMVSVDDGLDPAAGAEIAGILDRMFAELRRIGEAESARLGWFPAENIELTVRLVVGMVTSVAVLDNLVLPSRGRPTRDELLDHMTGLALYGLRRAPAGERPPGAG